MIVVEQEAFTLSFKIIAGLQKQISQGRAAHLPPESSIFVRRNKLCF